ncbi:pilus assembly protein PilZ [Rheinheimera sediminis]|uniref:PilZ domain-containing protein n=1 Tax=Rheinheimera sp. YQF-1 TaxID=2499626 RepID=UPI000FDC8528|nr:PilZ domain-containing protein [Rheinheimera sp. YQF-1]RVT45267.1 pilus assembly protein PilZ [Rheinheimera sp. YQF-1]
MNEIALDFTELKELYRCYMPFLKHGGLFVPGSLTYRIGQSISLTVTLPDEKQAVRVIGQVVWLTPQGAQSATPSGIGVAFVDDKFQLQEKIEKLLGAMLDSSEPRYSL